MIHFIPRNKNFITDFKSNRWEALWSGQASRGSFIWALLLALASGYSVNFIGTLYVADALAFLVGGYAVFDCVKRNKLMAPAIVFGLILAVFSGLYLLLDFMNGIGFLDYARGFARNFLFSFSVLAWLWVIAFFGLRRFLCIYGIFSVSPALLIAMGIATDFNYRENNLMNFFKYNGGGGLILVLTYLFNRSKVVLSIVLILWVFLLSVYADSRGGAGLAVAAFGLVALCKMSARFNPKLIAVILVISVSCMSYWLSNIMLSDSLFGIEKVERRLDSNRQRMDMFDFAKAEIEARPLTGYGSWQSAARYVDVQYQELYIPVHSVILQYVYEYGVAGVFYPFSILLITLWALPGALLFVRETDWGYSFIVFSMLIGQTMNLFLGGLSGSTRFLVAGGLAVSFMLILGARAINDKPNFGSHMGGFQSRPGR